jgi:hypothetical protein
MHSPPEKLLVRIILQMGRGGVGRTSGNGKERVKESDKDQATRRWQIKSRIRRQ